MVTFHLQIYKCYAVRKLQSKYRNVFLERLNVNRVERNHEEMTVSKIINFLLKCWEAKVDFFEGKRLTSFIV